MVNERVTRHCDTCSWLDKQYGNLPESTEDIALNLTFRNHRLLFHYGEVNKVILGSDECQRNGGK